MTLYLKKSNTKVFEVICGSECCRTGASQGKRDDDLKQEARTVVKPGVDMCRSGYEGLKFTVKPSRTALNLGADFSVFDL